MLKFTSVSGSVRAITADITLTVTIIRTGITIDLIIVPITGRIIGTAGIVIIATITVILIITGTSLTGIATPGWLEAISSQPNFFERKLAEEIRPHDTRRSIFLPFAKEPVWQVCPAHRAGTLFSTAESVPVFPFVFRFRFAAGAIARLFGVPECSGIRTERAAVNLVEDQSHELPHQLRA